MLFFFQFILFVVNDQVCRRNVDDERKNSSHHSKCDWRNYRDLKIFEKVLKFIKIIYFFQFILFVVNNKMCRRNFNDKRKNSSSHPKRDRRNYGF